MDITFSIGLPQSTQEF